MLLNSVSKYLLFLTALLVNPKQLNLSTNDINMTAQVIRDDVIPWQQFPITLIEKYPNKVRGKILLAQLDIVIAPLEGKEGCLCVRVFLHVWIYVCLTKNFCH